MRGKEYFRNFLLFRYVQRQTLLSGCPIILRVLSQRGLPRQVDKTVRVRKRQEFQLSLTMQVYRTSSTSVRKNVLFLLDLRSFHNLEFVNKELNIYYLR